MSYHLADSKWSITLCVIINFYDNRGAHPMNVSTSVTFLTGWCDVIHLLTVTLTLTLTLTLTRTLIGFEDRVISIPSPSPNPNLKPNPMSARTAYLSNDYTSIQWSTLWFINHSAFQLLQVV